MRTFRTALFGIIFAISSANTPVFANAPASIDAADIQHFEQTYEEWVQSLVQSIAPTIPATVLVELSYSNAPDKLQTYEELRAANHLPGLPEVTDPNFTYPSESPLFALVNQQHVKIIFEHDTSAAQKKILNEVLNTKLKINIARGDLIVFDHVNESLSPNRSLPFGRKEAAGLILLAFAGLILISLKRIATAQPILAAISPTPQARKTVVASVIAPIIKRVAKKNSIAKPAATPPVFKLMNNQEKLTEEKNLVQKMHQNHPRAFSQASKIMNPIQIILKSNPRHLIETVRTEHAENLANAIINSPAPFSNTLLQICTKEQAIAIKNILRTKKNDISDEKSKYAQLLLAAKINYESNTHLESEGNEAKL